MGVSTFKLTPTVPNFLRPIHPSIPDAWLIAAHGAGLFFATVVAWPMRLLILARDTY